MRCSINCNRRLPAFLIALLLFVLSLSAAITPAPFQQVTNRIVSKHLLIRIPTEREWLGQQTISELERRYLVIDKATGGSLPPKLLLDISWNEPVSAVRPGEAVVTIGMDSPAAAADGQRYLLHQATKEMARYGLLEVSKGGAGRPESRFLLEGMSEIMACEYEHSSRSLNAAWVRCHYMNEVEPLSLSALASWDRFSGDRHDQRAAAPGVTFLLNCRESRNRESLLKLFESMRRKPLPDSLAEAFKSTAAALETAWLDRIRSYHASEDSTVTSDEDAPRLERTVLEPEAGVPGQDIRIRVTIRDRSGDLFPDTIFLEEPESGRVLSAQNLPGAGTRYVQFRIPVPQDRKPGRYEYRLIAVDESGTVRTWPGAYPGAVK